MSELNAYLRTRAARQMAVSEVGTKYTNQLRSILIVSFTISIVIAIGLIRGVAEINPDLVKNFWGFLGILTLPFLVVLLPVINWTFPNIEQKASIAIKARQNEILDKWEKEDPCNEWEDK